jgi:hypothetical protein
MKKIRSKAKNYQDDDQEILNDDRFSSVFSDPRFMKVPAKAKKVEIDNRFAKVLTSKQFNVVQKVDKYGKKVNREDRSVK